MSRFDSHPAMSWGELQARLAGRAVDPLAEADGGDGPAFTRRRPAFTAPTLIRSTATVPYAELHCHSHFSFLDGASAPEDLVEEAARLGLTGLAITDHDGFYGVVPFAAAAREMGLPTVFGAELSLGLPTGQTGVPDPAGRHLLLLARGQEGYHRLAGVLGDAHLAGGEKGRPVYDLDEVAARLAGHVVALTGCRKGTVPAALAATGASAARTELDRLVDLFGAEHVAVELIDHGTQLDADRNDALADLAHGRGCRWWPPTTCTTTTRAGTGWPPSSPRCGPAPPWMTWTRSCRPPAPHTCARARRWPTGSVTIPARWRTPPGWARSARSTCRSSRRGLPPFDCPPGHTESTWLRHLTLQGAHAATGRPGRTRTRTGRSTTNWR